MCRAVSLTSLAVLLALSGSGRARADDRFRTIAPAGRPAAANARPAFPAARLVAPPLRPSLPPPPRPEFRGTISAQPVATGPGGPVVIGSVFSPGGPLTSVGFVPNGPPVLLNPPAGFIPRPDMATLPSGSVVDLAAGRVRGPVMTTPPPGELLGATVELRPFGLEVTSAPAGPGLQQGDVVLSINGTVAAIHPGLIPQLLRRGPVASIRVLRNVRVRTFDAFSGLFEEHVQPQELTLNLPVTGVGLR